jgi:hypothetical protein
MHNNIPELLRKEAVQNLFSTNTFNNSWAVWKPEIQRILGENFDENAVLNLGDYLTQIFRTTGTAGRGQGELSGGGAAWESLICWYINVCTVGSRIVAVKKMSLVPEPIRDAITVNYGNFGCNTESDITIIIFPNLPEYTQDINTLQIQNSQNQDIPVITRNGKINLNALNFLASRDFQQYEIGIIQCKTNWNDNAQIPMLWDMIYSAGGFRGRNITIGKNGYSIQNIHQFTYSFVTVPSNQNQNYSSNQVAVKRVTNLSGGNYWGQPTEQHVAKSIKEIFTNNFNNGTSGIRNGIRNAIPEFNPNQALSYFDFI